MQISPKITQTQFIVAAHLKPIDDELPDSFREICVIGDSPPPLGYMNYVDGVRGLSIDNKQLGELPALYFLLGTDVRCELFGFMHYRRFFLESDKLSSLDLRPVQGYDESWRGHYATNFANRRVIAEALLSEISSNLKEIIVPKKLQFHEHSLYSQFLRAHPQLDQAFLRACEIFDEVNELEPIDSIRRFLEDRNQGYFWNMFISDWDFYVDWSTCMYRVLERVSEFASYMPTLNPHNSSQHERWAGYFAERFFNYFLYIYQQKNQIAVIEKPVVLFVNN